MNRDYGRLLELLRKETYPLDYPIKFVGDTTPEFLQGVVDFERKFLKLQKQGTRSSSQGNHMSVSYLFIAASPEEIVLVLEAATEIPGVRVVL